ncbi:hypothetical protein LEP1GSC103_3363 [Leptospira borgpetersenii serovar Javanica str. UI 09931]|nr:hypothetical protein C4Q31_10425 [Leptospira borgpetersenii serovar Ceylonica]EKQ93376.1 hypothetical protein LEP1GSC101_3502 [Leptospira borgpetersenii str. UI 09149]EPG59331.1 hypothetical protein LEP1GSC103_3363 [Leptospira borgpetersenii serovar Javanica str. UI 09931]
MLGIKPFDCNFDSEAWNISALIRFRSDPHMGFFEINVQTNNTFNKLNIPFIKCIKIGPFVSDFY